MNLDQQIQALINNAPLYGVPSREIEAIAPVISSFARQRKHSQYYILQSLDEHWLVFTLSNRQQPEVEKNVIYAFTTVQDALNSPEAQGTQVVPKAIGVADIIFQMLAMETVDSIIFFEKSGNLKSGSEVSRQSLQHYLQQHIQKSRRKPQSDFLPPDIA